MSDQSLTRDEAIKLYGTEAATGWSRAAADQNFNANSNQTTTTSDYGFDFSIPTFDPSTIPVSQPTLVASTINIDDYIKAIQDTLPAPPEEYMSANPFYFDEKAATELATAEFSPYYDELLQDYLGEVKLTSEKNRGDNARILADLDKQKELFIQQNGKDFEKTIRGIKEGYSTKGTYFSGFNTRDQQEAAETNTNKISDYLNTYGTKKEDTLSTDTYQQEQSRRLADQRARDLGREKYAAIQGGVNTQKDEVLDEYLYGMKTYYKNPNWSSSLNNSTPDTYGNTNQQQGVSY